MQTYLRFYQPEEPPTLESDSDESTLDGVYVSNLHKNSIEESLIKQVVVERSIGGAVRLNQLNHSN